jgi:FAD-dependent urate hydroxylase
MIEQYDAAVIGAGPYGLSTAAHLLGRGLKVAIYGKPLELWRNHMPKGMRLRSHWWATNLADPKNEYGFDRFSRESSYRKCYPEPIDAFIDYAQWFQQRAVPNIDETYVSSIERVDHHFLLTLADGRQVQSDAVVMAVGLSYFAYRPDEFSDLPPEFASHSSEQNDCSRFQGKRVMVIGGGQSALEYSALLHEAGATVHSISRRPIDWLSPDREGRRTLLERMRAPRSGIAPGWVNWGLERMPYLFNRLPQQKKDRWLRPYLSAGVSAWVRDRVVGKVILHEGRTVTSVRLVNGTVEATLSDGDIITVDHVILATGYKVDVERLRMIDRSLRGEIKSYEGAPVLNSWFESSMPGLYFIGIASLNAFGPLYRFVAGCKAAAPRVASSIARKRRVVKPVPIRSRAKHAVARAVSWTHLDELARTSMHREVPFTASYHYVVERLNGNNGLALPAMQISAGMLEQHLDWLARNFQIISLDDLGAARRSFGSRPLAAVTFDDGYSDVYHHAFSLLKRKGIPAGIFVVTDSVGTTEPPMHERLHALLAKASRQKTFTARELVGVLRDSNVNVPAERVHKLVRDSFSATRFLLQTLTHSEVQRVIDRLQMDFALETSWQSGIQPLSWEMVREMRAAGLTIGSHSKTHAFLANESEDRVREEAEGSRRALESNLGVRADWFAYPGGSFNRTVIRAVADAGYKYAFTDCAHRDPEHPQLTLPRKTMWERSCLDPYDRFAPAIMSCHAAAMFERFSDCAGRH